MFQPPISKKQEDVFALAVFANLSDGLRKSTEPGCDIEERTLGALNRALVKAKPFIGGWNVVWGPSVHLFNSSVFAVNTMYVAQSTLDPAQYVVAIAGTNTTSVFDWMAEELLVALQVPWGGGAEASGAKIALGIASGLTVLQEMTPSGQRPGAGKTLAEFLTTLTGAKVKLDVTGFGLGGALASTVALWLADTKGLPGHWDPQDNAQLTCLSLAAPSAGNGAFASYADRKRGLKMVRFANDLDIVPQAWNAASLAKVATLYSPIIPGTEPIRALVEMTEQTTRKGNYTQVQAMAPPLMGRVKYNEGFITVPPSPGGHFVDFIKQVGYQHIGPYFDWFHFNPNWMEALPSAFEEDSRALFAELAPGVRRALRAAGVQPPAELPGKNEGEGLRTLQAGRELYPVPQSVEGPAAENLVNVLATALKRNASPRN
ncbi:lipase family protein [Stigmatella aurantiaca]|uniref:Lipase family protein n=1 Tax=Stigmatella aurantiaca (strain DW4/3-1) TaxID=378806 RepID=E3FKH5_STIAD|nr:lipase [Stigmatella aurantiaca]ADO67948.1 Lipase family protein [Stigmatella aurantiaca DW4/3-1]